MTWWLQPLRLDSQIILGNRSKRSEHDLMAKTIKAWFMEAYPTLVNNLAIKKILTRGEISREREREDMNYYLPAGPDTCLSILASCDRYPQG